MLGCDIGTYNIVCCSKDNNNNYVYDREVNAFLEISLEDRLVLQMMKSVDVPVIERAKKAYALGEKAVRMAYTLSQLELKRPMKDGCVNPKEKDAFEILSIMIHSLLEGNVKIDKETLYYSVPANALNEETDAEYHSKVLESILNSYVSEEGFKIKPFPINEGLALVYAELKSNNYTGLGVSCLCPGTKIYTKNGIKNIEDVVIGDEVITHKGRWKKVYNIISKDFKGKSTTVRLSGYSGGIENYKFVDNHELYVKRSDKWSWIGCDELKVEDIVGEPILRDGHSPKDITIQERTTCSKTYKNSNIAIDENFCELIGYFLGDGSINLSEQCIQFDFANKETDNIDKVQSLIKKVFDKPSSQTIKSENCTRIKCYSKSLTQWFKENCYENKIKKSPINIEGLKQQECAAMLRGLIMSDGRVAKDAVCFYNTNTNLIILTKQLFSKIGIAASMSHRNPRKGGKIGNRQIQGKLVEWIVTTGANDSFKKLNEILGCGNKGYIIERQRMWTEEDFCCSKIRNIQIDEYDGIVYDLQVEDDHSFSGPYLTISNCGAGMVNVCYAMFGVPVFQFALVNSGDWIDKMAAKATGENTTFINQEKTKVNLSQDPKDLIERAIQTQYRIMIEKTVNGIKKGLGESGKKARSDKPIDIVIAGGTSMPIGFDVLFRDVVTQSDLPISVGTIVRPSDPLFSVSKGCLIAAENSLQ